VSEAVLELLVQMQEEMERLALWKTVPPTEDQFQSDVPFCMNTLACSQWLQWVYIARLNALIEGGDSLPRGGQVHPYAEEAFKVEGIESKALLAMIAQLDKLLA
jgi:uncharacterized protein YqcC (DUF446 family)